MAGTIHVDIVSPEGSLYVAGVAKNGVEMKAFARVTVRANIAQFVGGAGGADGPCACRRGHRHDHRLGGDAS